MSIPQCIISEFPDTLSQWKHLRFCLSISGNSSKKLLTCHIALYSFGHHKWVHHFYQPNTYMFTYGHSYWHPHCNKAIHYYFQNRKANIFLKMRNLNPNRSPFFMMLSTPSCHAPFTPAPQYNNTFSDKMAPRTPSFNTHGDVSSSP